MYTYLAFSEFYTEFLTVWQACNLHISSWIDARPKAVNGPTIWAIFGASCKTHAHARRIPHHQLIEIKLYFAVWIGHKERKRKTQKKKTWYFNDWHDTRLIMGLMVVWDCLVSCDRASFSIWGSIFIVCFCCCCFLLKCFERPQFFLVLALYIYIFVCTWYARNELLIIYLCFESCLVTQLVDMSFY